MRKLLLLISFFSLTPALLIVTSIFLLSLLFQNKTSGVLSFLLTSNRPIAYAALPTNLTMEANVTTSDARLAKVLNFFEQNNSALTPYAATIIADADKYGINYQLLPAIAMQETTLCKTEIPGTHNCWGYGIYTHHVTSFTSYEDAIDTISRYFAKENARGINSIEAIGSIYNPQNSNGWIGHVTYFMNQL